jgi:dethiobiotin synthetase
VPSVFVTSTGTEIGKTFVTAGLVRHLRTAGRAVNAIKPVISGFDPEAAAGSDSGVLLQALDRPVTTEELERISPWRFKAAVAPDLAAKRENRSIDFRALVRFCESAVTPRELLLIEGVGGVMVPLDDRRTVIDWICALRIPVVLVVGSYLGTISHTLTALHVLAQRNLETTAIVISETPGSTVSLDDTVASINRFGDLIDIVALPRLTPGEHSHPAFARLAGLLA